MSDNPSVELAPLRGSITLDLDEFNEGIEEVREEAESLKDLFTDIVVNLHLEGLEEAQAELDAFRSLLDSIDTEAIANFNLDGVFEASAEIEELNRQIEQTKAELDGLKGSGEEGLGGLGEESEESEEKVAGLGERISGMGDELMNFGMNAAFIFSMPLALGFEKATELSAGLNANINLSNRLFGKNSVVTSLATDSINKLGMSSSGVYKLADSFGLAFNGMGATKTQSALLSSKMVELAQNMNLATGGNISLQQASQALVGLLGGNTFALKSMGFNLSQTALQQAALNSKWHEAYAQMTPYQKAVIETSVLQKMLNKSLGSLSGNLNSQYGSLSKLKAQFENFGEVVGKALAPQVAWLTKKVEELTTWFENLSPHSKKLLIYGAEALAIIPVLALGIGGITQTFKLMGRVFSGVCSLFAMNPIVATIAVIIAATVGLYEAWTHNWFGIRTKTFEVLDELKEKWDSFITYWGDEFDRFGDYIEHGWDYIVNSCSNAIHRLESNFESFKVYWSNIFADIGKSLDSFMSWVGAKASDFLQGAEHLGSDLVHSTVRILESIAEAIYNNPIVHQIAKIDMSILHLLEACGEAIYSITGALIERVGSDISNFFSYLLNLSEEQLNYEISKVESFGSWIGSEISNMMSYLGNIISSGWNDISNWWSNGWNYINQITMNFSNDVTNDIQGFCNSVANYFEGIGERIGSIASSMWNTVSSAFESGISYVGNVFESGWNGVCSWFSSAVMEPVRELEGMFGAWESAGSRLIQGFLSGIENGWYAVTNWISSAISNLASEVSSEASHIVGDITGSHATGLDFVPWDGYTAELHKGEMVLTADEAEAYKSGSSGGNTSNTTFNISGGNAFDIAQQVQDTINKISNGFI